MTDTLTTSDLADLFPGPVIVTPLIAAPVNGAVVYWNDDTNEGFVIQPLYTDKDREAMRRRMLNIVERQSS